MYVVLVYDIGEKRVSKVLKLCRQYLHRVQNSVFEGNLSEKNFNELQRRLNSIINKNHDTIIIFNFQSENAVKRITLGIDNKKPDLFVDEDSF